MTFGSVIYSFPLPKEKISFGAGIGKEYPFRKFACPCLWLARQILCIDATNDTSSPGCAKSLHGIYTNTYIPFGIYTFYTK